MSSDVKELDEVVNEVEMKSSVQPSPKARKIGFKWTINRIAEVDTVHQLFDTIFSLTLIWEPIEGEEEEVETYIDQDPDWQPKWKPMLSLPNAITKTYDPKNGKSNMYYIKKVKGKPMYHYDIQVQATMAEEMELQAFPFDEQDLSLLIKLGNGINKCYFVPYFGQTKFMKVKRAQCVLTDWDWYPPLLEFRYTDPNMSKTKKSFSTVRLRLKFQRKYQFYIQRIALITALISLSTVMVFSVSPDETADRLGLIATLLLTIIAFQFVITQFLPSLSFLTVLDQYMLSGIMYIVAAGLETCILPSLDEDQIDDVDRWTFWGLLICWVVIQIIFAIISYRHFLHEQKKLTMTTEELDNLMGRNTGKEVDNYSFSLENADDIDFGSQTLQCETIYKRR